MSESDEQRTQEDPAEVEGHRLLADPVARQMDPDGFRVARDEEDDTPDFEGHRFVARKPRARKA